MEFELNALAMGAPKLLRFCVAMERKRKGGQRDGAKAPEGPK